MGIYSETTSNTPDLDINFEECETCTFECDYIGFCPNTQGINYVINSLFIEKGYTVAREDWGRTPKGEFAYGVGMYKREAKKFMKIMEKQGHTCTLYQHPKGKKSWAIVIIDNGVEPLELAKDFKKMEAIA